MAMSNFHTSAANLCNVCIDRASIEELSGRFYHYYSPQPVPFQSHYHLVMQIDRLCDRLNYPQAEETLRGFKGTFTPRLSQPDKMTRCISEEELLSHSGEVATFLIQVMYRQHATWQGSVTWVETNQTLNFRSALELIDLMDSAVQSALSNDEEKPRASGQ